MNYFELKGMLLNNVVTAFLAERMIDVVDVCKYLMTGSYSQDREDLIIRELLVNEFHKEMSDISYLDIGANRWRHGSNTYLLYRMRKKVGGVF